MRGLTAPKLIRSASSDTDKTKKPKPANDETGPTTTKPKPAPPKAQPSDKQLGKRKLDEPTQNPKADPKAKNPRTRQATSRMPTEILDASSKPSATDTKKQRGLASNLKPSTEPRKKQPKRTTRGTTKDSGKDDKGSV